MTLDNQFVMRIVTCKAGSISIRYKGTDIVLKPDEMMFLPQNTGNYMLTIKKSEDYIGSAFACKASLVKRAFQFNTTMRNIAIYLHNHPVIHWHVDDSLAITIRDLLLYATSESRAIFQEEMVRSLFLFLLFSIISKIAEKAEHTDERMLNRGEVLFMKFLGLLNQHFKEEREVAFYADQLHLSPKYLSAICKEQSGKTASTWINEAVIEEIRHQLLHSDLSVKEICVLMNFPNISFFGRYVKKHLGHSPQTFRKLVNTSNEV
ncbi:MAG: AraC family transcriptional regulator [Bacteroidaceae bacterium]|nr:AraC family transcriptional regulator [Bacteroidaceae bacterium]